MEHHCGWGRFQIISEDSKALDEFAALAEQAAIFHKRQPGICFCRGHGPAREQAAALLAGLFFGPWEQRRLAELAQSRYECFTAAEMSLLLEKATFLSEEDDFCWGLFAGEKRRQRLAQALAGHLHQNLRLNLQGFCRFRLQGYREYLQTLLSIAADEVLSEQEEEEYLALLRQFMATRPSGGDIHVFVLRRGLYDICIKAPDGLHFVEGGHLRGCEDILLFALLTLAPQKLSLHVEQPLPPSLYRLLQALFPENLHLELVCHIYPSY